MISNHIKLSLRTLLRQKRFSLIAIGGLALGIAAFLAIFQYVNYETGYDKFQPESDRIYRIKQDRINDGILGTERVTANPAIGYHLTESLPEVESFVRMATTSGTISVSDNDYSEENILYASDSFFQVFAPKALEGNLEDALTAPNSIVLTGKMARKYFGNEPALGKILEYKRGRSARKMTVTAVIEDLPRQSHMVYDLLFSWSTFSAGRDARYNNMWINDGFYTYLLLKEGTNLEALKGKVAELVKEKSSEELKAFSQELRITLQPLSSIHLESNFLGEFKTNGDARMVGILKIVGVLIIVLAWINYINLSTAMALNRAREVGLRKILGSKRIDILYRSIAEAAIFNAMAIAISLVLLLIFTPWLSQISGADSIGSQMITVEFWMGMAILFLISSLCSGLYPAMVLSSFQPSRMVLSKNRSHLGTRFFRQGLVVFQFICASAVLMTTFMIQNQLKFINNKDLGVDLEKTMIVKGPGYIDSTYQQRASSFIEDLTAHSAINDVVVSSHVPGSPVTWGALGVRKEGAPTGEGKQFKVMSMGFDFIESYGLQLIAGRAFAEGFGNDTQNLIFSRSAVEHFGLNNPEEAIGMRVHLWSNVYTVVGVLEDYHHTSLRDKIEATVYRCMPTVRGLYSVKYNSEDPLQIRKTVEGKWAEHFPGNPFEYFFLEENFQEQYQAERQFGDVFMIFSCLAIFVACLGLFGLAAFVAARRTKEIGIRKVLGASVTGLLRHLSTDFVKLIVISIFLAIPMAYYAMDQWLNGFAFRAGLSWYIFLIPAVVVLLIALATVSFHTTKVARANPVDSLRYE